MSEILDCYSSLGARYCGLRHPRILLGSHVPSIQSAPHIGTAAACVSTEFTIPAATPVAKAQPIREQYRRI
jgi:hypothetical protein